MALGRSHIVTGRKARKFCTAMLAWLDQKTEIVEHADQSAQYFEPAHAAYYGGKPGQPLKLMLQARSDFLSIWRRADYREHVAEFKLLGRQLVIVNSPEAIRYVVAKRHENFERKTPQMRRALEYLLGDGLFISDKETWKQRRPLVSDIVHKNRVPAFGSIMQSTASELADRWQSLGEGAEVNALFEMAGLTAEIISRSVFGNDLGEESANAVTEGFASYQSLVDSINFGYFLGFDEGLPIIRTPSLNRSVKRIHRIIDQVIEDHLAGKGDNSSMVELLIRRQQRNPELKLDVVALRNEAATIFMAGHETTAATLTWAWYLLAGAPWVEEAVHAEIEAVCGDRVPSIDDVAKLDWCRAVIEETLRLYPPVPILARQAAEPDQIGDVKIRKAALVLIVPWILHRTDSLFPEPHRFYPERFLGEARPTPYSYIPFAAGPRVCPGLQFGLTEAILCLAILAQRFRVRVRDGHKVQPQCRLTLRPRDGMPVTLHRRRG
ncbi:cytochrome P450 [Rhizobium sp. ERR 922]|uniref:cytochrome P450 n=1 Tax=unclassified Rhizobium TaxID=2613769 RepID=UPI0011ACE073|nr:MULTISPECIES: cytochrome P450 [unclassified Rhizobium]TWB46744.1 cytochrome P450 [Rhizobium sp. ERR 922]TWB89141.1 cytochrome P450 [Rhizobium sp. ERR 942]